MRGGFIIKIKIINLLLVFFISCSFIGCSNINTIEENEDVQLIIYSNNSMEVDEVEEQINKVLNKDSETTKVVQVDKEDNNKFIVTLKSKIDEDEIKSKIEQQEWVKRVQINYKININ